MMQQPCAWLRWFYDLCFPWHRELSLITGIFICINMICNAASQDSGVRVVKTSALGGSWGAAGEKQLLGSTWGWM